uniref:EF-hand domain-containing protein n=1 Tax=Chaetoceros debilis TaxID=122233 RepID=A0A7S3V7V9_9STRA
MTSSSITTKGGKYKYKYLVRFAFRAVLFVGLIAAFAVYNNYGRDNGNSLNGQNHDDHRRLADVNNSTDVNNVSNMNGIFQIRAEPVWLLAPYILGILYTFLALAIICDEYFVPALEEMSGENQLNLSLDIAGATLMAAGGSAPELFTSLIGTFNQSSLGFGAIVGSAVFNVLFVIGMCSLLSKDVLQLTWWPLARDTSYYAISLLTLAIFVGVVSPGEVEMWEACVLFAMYFGYVGVMAMNQRLYKMITGQDLYSDEEHNSSGSLISFRYPTSFRAGLLTLIRDPDSWLDKARIGLVSKISGNVDDVFAFVDSNGDGEISREELSIFFNKLEDNNVSDEELDKIMADLDTNNNGFVNKNEFKAWYLHSEAHVREQIRKVFENYDSNRSGGISEDEFKMMIDEVIPSLNNDDDIQEAITQLFKGGSTELTFDDFADWYLRSTYYEKQTQKVQKEEEGETLCETLSPPSNAGFFGYLKWIFLFPLVFSFAITVPDVRRKGVPGKMCYVAFVMSILWIGVFSFFMVGWAECVGATAGIPPYIMGLTFIAAGTSVPDLISSVIVARMGEGDMAVSSSIGSNIFDILVGLPLPWLIFMFYPNKPTNISKVKIGADGVWLSIMILLGMLVLIVVCIHLSKWRLTKQLGTTMFFFYLCFLVQAVVRSELSKDQVD